MSAQILDGKKLAGDLEKDLRIAIQKSGKSPRLSAVLVGDHGASATYVRNKLLACRRVDIDCQIHSQSSHISQNTLIALIDQLNCDKEVDAILVQLPLPAHIDAEVVVSCIDPAKDVDGLTYLSRGKLMGGDKSAFIPPTALGIQWLLQSSGALYPGTRVVVAGRSSIVGRPLSVLLSHKSFGGNATVTLAHSASQHLASLCKEADILIAAIGCAQQIDASYLKPGGVVIDVGIHRTSLGLVGDVLAADADQIARLRSPVPGGVGPLTVHCLLHNVARAAGVQPSIKKAALATCS